MCMFTRGLMSEDNDSCIEVQLNVTDAKLYASYISNPQCQGKWTKGHKHARVISSQNNSASTSFINYQLSPCLTLF